MEFTYTPHGVCSRQILLELDGNKVSNVRFIGGCSGNTQGVARLAEGMEVDELISRLQGIRCGSKPTSCPDQLAKALLAAKAGAGTLVPITGFANSVVSPAIEFKAEGWVTGVGARIFGIAGPVIAFGTLASFVWGVLYWLLGKVG